MVNGVWAATRPAKTAIPTNSRMIQRWCFIRASGLFQLNGDHARLAADDSLPVHESAPAEPHLALVPLENRRLTVARKRSCGARIDSNDDHIARMEVKWCLRRWPGYLPHRDTIVLEQLGCTHP